jgi:hypothetical protein
MVAATQTGNTYVRARKIHLPVRAAAGVGLTQLVYISGEYFQHFTSMGQVHLSGVQIDIKAAATSVY